MVENGGAAGCCCSFIFTSGLTVLFMWLSLRTHKPSCSIQRFYVPGLNRSHNSTANHTITFDLKLDNVMKDKGVRYDTINLTFSYAPNGSRPVATDTLQGFYQGHGKKANRKNRAVEAVGVPWAEAVDAVSNGTVLFRVDLATWVRYKIVFWYTKRERLAVGGNVTVGSSGENEGKKKKKGVKLKSKSADEPRGHWVRVGVLLAVSTFLLCLI